MKIRKDRYESPELEELQINLFTADAGISKGEQIKSDESEDDLLD